MKLSRLLCAGLIGMAFAGVSAEANAQAQSEEISAACALKKDVYTCDKEKFQQVVEHAKTAAIETAPTDAVAQNALKKVVASTGKTLVEKTERPDLTFVLVPADQSGVQYTSNRSALAALRIFAVNSESGRRELVWAENFTGEADTPWPLVVSRLTGQFKSRFAAKH